MTFVLLPRLTLLNLLSLIYLFYYRNDGSTFPSARETYAVIGAPSGSWNNSSIGLKLIAKIS